ncbi:MAG: NADH:ubiquinone reductase (Na(+)-transporting) subunit D [Spirochaetales bacterium]|nr:NADH:ubiquinone reductase (Na(+)-transporting) subunit D [Spirochaetales bacterium]
MSDVVDIRPGAILKNNLWSNNPIFMQILGICSALAVTNLLTNTAIMTLGVTLVTGFSSLTVSLLKKLIPRKVRMIVQTLIIAFYVIIVDLVLKAFLPEISKNLGPYVGLIITNCIIMGRAEAFAQSNGPIVSFWDGITSGLGYMGVLLVMAVFRELLGFGTLFGYQIMPAAFVPWTIMVMPPSAFFLLGLIIWAGKTMMGGEKA